MPASVANNNIVQRAGDRGGVGHARVLPEALRPPLWRRSLVGMALFYGYFVTLVARSFAA